MEQINTQSTRIAVFGDNCGMPQLLKILPAESIVCAIASGNRPQYHQELHKLTADAEIPLIVQPKFTSPEFPLFIKRIQDYRPELFICNSYSLKIPEKLLELVQFNALNVHWSLLPNNRGPNPTQWAIIKGEKVTGVSIHFMTEKIDEGDLIAQEREVIGDLDTWVSVNKRLEKLAFYLLKETLPSFLHGTYQRIPQDHCRATTNPRLTPEFPRIDFSCMTNQQVYDLIRAQVFPLTGAFIDDPVKGRVHFPSLVPMEEVERMRVAYG